MDNIELKFCGVGDNVLVVLTGIGGTINGYDDKYIKIANNIISKTEFSVAIAAIPHGAWECTNKVFNNILKRVREKYKGDVYIMGVSAGGSISLLHSFCYPQSNKSLNSL